jgi:hypothetical protein
MLLTDYPGYERASQRARQLEDYLRDLPFLFSLDTIRGVTVRQLTPRMCGLLLFARSPFLYKGATRRPDDVARFLWVVSPEYKPDQAAADAYMKSIPLIKATREGRLFPVFNSFCRAIGRYIDRAFFDQPPSAAESGPIFPVAYQTAIIHPIARGYSWPAERILDMPVAQLYQLLKCIQRERSAAAGMGIPVFSPYQDKVDRRIILRWHRRAHAAGMSVEDYVAQFKARGAA